MGNLNVSAERPLVVGIVHDAQSLDQIKQGLVSTETCDVLEIRLDAFREEGTMSPLTWFTGIENCPPILITARSPREGGLNDLSAQQRNTMVKDALDACADVSAVDVEISSFPEMETVLDRVREEDKLLVASFHNFEKTPDRKKLVEAIETARSRGAGVAKIATFLEGPADAATLLGLLADDFGIPLSVMGMGRLGGASRLLFAQCGSVLNYGHLGSSNAPGQWHACDLRERLNA